MNRAWSGVTRRQGWPSVSGGIRPRFGALLILNWLFYGLVIPVFYARSYLVAYLVGGCCSVFAVSFLVLGRRWRRVVWDSTMASKLLETLSQTDHYGLRHLGKGRLDMVSERALKVGLAHVRYRRTAPVLCCGPTLIWVAVFEEALIRQIGQVVRLQPTEILWDIALCGIGWLLFVLVSWISLTRSQRRLTNELESRCAIL